MVVFSNNWRAEVLELVHFLHNPQSVAENGIQTFSNVVKRKRKEKEILPLKAGLLLVTL